MSNKSDAASGLPVNHNPMLPIGKRPFCIILRFSLDYSEMQCIMVMAKEIAQNRQNTVYLNYDSTEDRKIIKNEGWLNTTELLILDELHKMPDWKNYIKGVFDTRPGSMRLLVAGSARLEAFRQTGDSPAGRYFSHRLLPISPAEAKSVGVQTDLERFMTRGGFPEPFLAEDSVDADRWRMQYIDGLIRTDILDFEKHCSFYSQRTQVVFF